MEFNEKQIQIMEAAEKLFAEKGFAGTSVRDIADECWCKPCYDLLLFRFQRKIDGDHFQIPGRIYHTATGKHAAG